ncbi:hypothetical protein A8709_27225 [Paenibacillus pectinilyticus]|uniref:Membrane-spanning protein n=1 Tax=Paenibacillus pectinilyticus TaxID=512399 RepID=A0A1C1A1U2_9BACL|nr:hypothetical protein [Paenibacillus pectinilyticus]OCT14495.1 hypothetical protein A8709_27225 [Paenibacillus pectinilyticus]
MKHKDRGNDLFEFAMYVLAAGCFIYFLVKGNGAKMFEAALIVAVLLLIRLVVRLTKTTLFPALRFCILLFISVTMFIANEFGYYGVIPYLDKIEHLFSGVILCFIGLLIYSKAAGHQEGNQHPSSRVAVWLCLFFSIAMAGVWEIYEFTTDHFFGLNSQNGSLIDTMTDIICGTSGAIVTSVYLALKARQKMLPLVDIKG